MVETIMGSSCSRRRKSRGFLMIFFIIFLIVSNWYNRILLNKNNDSISDPDEISMQLTSIISFCDDLKNDIKNSLIIKEIPTNLN